MTTMTVAERQVDVALAGITMTFPVPCVRYPGATRVHFDGACRCFTGGPAPEQNPAASCARRPGYRHFDGPCQCFTGGRAPSYPASSGVPEQR